MEIPQQLWDALEQILGSVGLTFQDVLEMSGLVFVATQWLKQYVPVEGVIVIPLWAGNEFKIEGVWILALVVALILCTLWYYPIGIGAVLVGAAFSWLASVFGKSTINQFRTGRSIKDKRKGGN